MDLALGDNVFKDACRDFHKRFDVSFGNTKLRILLLQFVLNIFILLVELDHVAVDFAQCRFKVLDFAFFLLTGRPRLL